MAHSQDIQNSSPRNGNGALPESGYAQSWGDKFLIMAHSQDMQNSSTRNGNNILPENDYARSWGDRLKKAVFNKELYFGINYLLNAAISTVVTYIVEHRWQANINQFCDAQFGFMSSYAKWTSRTFLITSGGNVLVPVIKKFEDHRQGLQFGIGHQLDRLQQALGKGNNASRRNIADYHKIKTVLRAGNDAGITDEEKSRWKEKYRLQMDNGRPHFKEHILPWSKAWFSRLGAWTTAWIFNAGVLGSLDRLPADHTFNYKRFARSTAAPWVNRTILQRVGLGRLFDDPEHFAEIMFNESISTLSSSIPHRFIQGALHNEKKHAGQEKVQQHAPTTGRTPAELARRAKVADGQTDFRTREAEKTSETGMSLP